MEQYLYGRLDRQDYRLLTSAPGWQPSWHQTLLETIIPYDTATPRPGYSIDKPPVSFQYFTCNPQRNHRGKQQLFQQSGLDPLEQGMYAHGYLYDLRGGQEYGDPFLQKLCIRFRSLQELIAAPPQNLTAQIPDYLMLPMFSPPCQVIMHALLHGLYTSQRVIVVLEQTGEGFYPAARALLYWIYERLPYCLRERIGCNAGCSPAQLQQTGFSSDYRLILLENPLAAEALHSDKQDLVLRMAEGTCQLPLLSPVQSAFYEYLYGAGSAELSEFFRVCAQSLEKGSSPTYESYIGFFSMFRKWRTAPVAECLPEWIFLYAAESKTSNVYPFLIETARKRVMPEHACQFYSKDFYAATPLPQIGAAPPAAELSSCISGRRDRCGFFSLRFFADLLDDSALRRLAESIAGGYAERSPVQCMPHSSREAQTELLWQCRMSMEEIARSAAPHGRQAQLVLLILQTASTQLQKQMETMNTRMTAAIDREFSGFRQDLQEALQQVRAAPGEASAGRLADLLQNKAAGVYPCFSEYADRVGPLFLSALQAILFAPCEHYMDYKSRADFIDLLLRELPAEFFPEKAPEMTEIRRWLASAENTWQGVAQLRSWSDIFSVLTNDFLRRYPDLSQSVFDTMNLLCQSFDGYAERRLLDEHGAFIEKTLALFRMQDPPAERRPIMNLVHCYAGQVLDNLQIPLGNSADILSELETMQNLAKMIKRQPRIRVLHPGGEQLAELSLSEYLHLLKTLPDHGFPPLSTAARKFLLQAPVLNFFIENMQAESPAETLLYQLERRQTLPFLLAASKNPHLGRYPVLVGRAGGLLTQLTDQELAELQTQLLTLEKGNPWRRGLQKHMPGGWTHRSAQEGKAIKPAPRQSGPSRQTVLRGGACLLWAAAVITILLSLLLGGQQTAAEASFASLCLMIAGAACAAAGGLLFALARRRPQ